MTIKQDQLLPMDPTNSKIINICSYNMHGLNVGLTMLQDLTLSHDIIALQEHWLCDNNMHKLGICNDNFMFHGISSMDECLSAGLL